MIIFPLVINTAKPCDLVKNMATVNVGLALDQKEAGSNYYIQRAEGYSSYYLSLIHI